MLSGAVPITPIHFFSLEVELAHFKGKKKLPFKKPYLLPDLAALHGQKPFARAAFGWNEGGIIFAVEVEGHFETPDYPSFRKGDAIELFLDTRDMKTSHGVSRFCHHFFFLPQPFELSGESIQAGEVTRFRLEDRHELCDPSLLELSVSFEKKKSLIEVFIPQECLHGYDPHVFDRLGIHYRISRITGKEQEFSTSSEDINIEKYPHLFASGVLVKEK